MSRWREMLIVALAAGFAFTSVQAAGVEAGHDAPAFDLSRIGGEGYIRSQELFSGYRYIFLAFWKSGCPHCVEVLGDCESFYREYAGDDITVVGINSDEGDMLRVQELLDANGVTFPQLWDRGTRVTKFYGVPLATFTIYLVGDGGKVLASVFDPQGDIAEVMEEMLVGGETAPSAETEGKIPVIGGGPIEPVAGFVFSGRERIRFLGIDSQGAQAVGPYGENVESKNELLYRFDLEMTRGLGRHLAVGGLLRLSNEGEEVIASGPDYFGAQWGSAFAEITWNRFDLRLGYYPIRMTPLTLMRWDWDDNPRTGGDAGCGCGAAAGVLLLESLEELGPDLTFEGGIAGFTGKGFETRLFYAIPRRPREVSYQEQRATGADPADYSLEIYGFESRLSRHDGRTGSAWELGIHLVGSWENKRSVDFKGLGYAVPYPWYESYLMTLTGNIPVLRGVDLRGEWIAANRAESHGMDVIPGIYNERLKGKGGIGGIAFDWAPRFTLNCDYLYLDDDFYSSFSALSYEPNTEGVRLSSRLLIPELRLLSMTLLPGDISAVSLFYKRLREIDTDGGAEKGRISYFGASIDFDHPSGVGWSIGWLDLGNWRGGDIAGHDDYRRVLAIDGRYRFSKASYIQAQYQWIDSEMNTPGVKLESRTFLYSVYFVTVF